MLVLIIDNHNMISSKVMAATKRNTRQCMYNGQNNNKVWRGGASGTVFKDYYQLIPIAEDAALRGFTNNQNGVQQHVTNKMSSL